jgi:hypothetical protein
MHSLPQKTFTPEDGPQGCSVSTKNKLVFFVETALGAKHCSTPILGLIAKLLV